MIDMSAELYQRIDEVIHYMWDPIGISGIVECRDEYYSYLPKISAIVANDTQKDLVKYLIHIEDEWLGFPSRGERKKRKVEVEAIVKTIFKWKKILQERQDYFNDKPRQSI